MLGKQIISQLNHRTSTQIRTRTRVGTLTLIPNNKTRNKHPTLGTCTQIKTWKRNCLSGLFLNPLRQFAQASGQNETAAERRLLLFRGDYEINATSTLDQAPRNNRQASNLTSRSLDAIHQILLVKRRTICGRASHCPRFDIPPRR